MKEELKAKLNRTIGNAEKTRIKEWMTQENVPLNSLFELITYKDEPKIAFRAAWIFEGIVLSDFEKIEPFLMDFLGIFPSIDNRSIHRHFSKIICKLLEADAKSEKFNPNISKILRSYDFENIAEALFRWLIDDKERVGVKVWCIEALYYLSIRYPWILEELEPQIAFLSDKTSAGFLPRGRKVKAFLEGEQ